MASNNYAVAVAGIALFICGSTSACQTGPDLSDLRKPTPAAVKTQVPEQELSGVYTVSGRNENSAKPYGGSLTVENREEGYRFNWQTNLDKYNGSGVQMNDAVAVSYTDGLDGKDCGVVLYKIAVDGSLDGRVVTYGEYTYGTETAVRMEGDSFDGKYSVSGKTNYGREYKGIIDIARNGSGYQAKWGGGVSRIGFGTWRGDVAAISFGGTQCSFVLFKVQPGGALEGRWGSQRTVAFGTENAKKQ